jgi:hypothetical protein
MFGHLKTVKKTLQLIGKQKEMKPIGSLDT